MPKYMKDVQRLRNPENIREALYASSPYVLRKAFVADPTVQKLIRAGLNDIPGPPLAECFPDQLFQFRIHFLLLRPDGFIEVGLELRQLW